MFTSVFGLSIKYEAWNLQNSLPIILQKVTILHSIYRKQTLYNACSDRRTFNSSGTEKTNC